MVDFGPPGAEKLIFSDKTSACLNDCSPKHILSGGGALQVNFDVVLGGGIVQVNLVLSGGRSAIAPVRVGKPLPSLPGYCSEIIITLCIFVIAKIHFFNSFLK